MFFACKASSELHKLIATADQWPATLERIKTYPAEVFKVWKLKIRADEIEKVVKLYPLHHCVYNGAPNSVVIPLVEAFPRAIKIPDSGYRRYPLHYAVLSGGHPEVTLELMKRYPKALTKADALGRLPLHYALFLKMPYGVIEKMINLYPEAISHRDYQGWTVAHVAGHAGAPLNYWKLLVRTRPTVIRIPERNGFGIRDFAMINGEVPHDVISYLMRRTPSSIVLDDAVIELYQKNYQITRDDHDTRS
mmetsp:Transcript_4541/g.6546  ORF Transcript_4541/g.6546 Transcript_4541/m.6546 type:complete len:249 (-) Transcript_4541:142-888(-)